MGAVKVSDVMSFFPGMSAVNDSKAGAIQGADDFAKAISDAAAKTAPPAGVNDADTVRQAPKSTRLMQKTDNNDTGRILKDDAGKDQRTDTYKSDSVDREEIGAGIDEKLGKVKDAVKDELGVTDEELEEAMAMLGMAPVDLLNPDNLKGLMLELSGETDPLALITNGDLLDSIHDVTALVSEILTELQEEFGIAADDIADVLGMTALDENIPDEAAFIEDEDADQDDADGVRIEITHKDEDGTANDGIGERTTAESVSLDRKAARIMNDRNQEEGTQNAMTGQNFNVDAPDADGIVQAVPEQAPSYVDAEDILSQVTDRIKVDISEDQTSMELQLHPASLGTVNLQVNSNGGVVTAHLLVQNEAVKTVLEGQLIQLLQTFEEQGQKVEAIEVSVAGYDLDRSLNQDNDTGSNERQERKADGVGRTSRRRLNLNELDEEDLEDMTEEEQLAAEMMTANGGSVDYMV